MSQSPSHNWDDSFSWKVSMDDLAPVEPSGREIAVTDEAAYKRAVTNIVCAMTAALDRLIGSFDTVAIRQVIDLSDTLQHLMQAHGVSDPFSELAQGVLRQYVQALVQWRRIGLAIMDGLEQLYSANALVALANLSLGRERIAQRLGQHAYRVVRAVESMDRWEIPNQWIEVDPYEAAQFYTIRVEEGSQGDDEGSTHV